MRYLHAARAQTNCRLKNRNFGAIAPAYAALAQLVEHRIRNAGAVGSNPIGGTILSA